MSSDDLFQLGKRLSEEMVERMRAPRPTQPEHHDDRPACQTRHFFIKSLRRGLLQELRRRPNPWNLFSGATGIEFADSNDGMFRALAELVDEEMIESHEDGRFSLLPKGRFQAEMDARGLR